MDKYQVLRAFDEIESGTLVKHLNVQEEWRISAFGGDVTKVKPAEGDHEGEEYWVPVSSVYPRGEGPLAEETAEEEEN